MAEQEVQAIFTADISGITSGAQSAIKSMQSVQSSTKSVSDSVSATTSAIGKSMIGVGTATTIMGVKALKGYGDFEASLNKAAVIAGGTSKDIQGLADVANKMGAELPLSAQDAADAMVAMARDGASIGTIKKEFPAIAEAATAAGADLQQTASVVQQSMNIWGDSLKSPARAAAILTQTANLSNASIEDMQQALATIGGTANNAGISMEDTSTAIGLLTNRGFSAAQASQDLNHALLLMQAPSKQAAAQAQALGINFNDAQGNMKPLPQILNEIADATANMSSSDKAAALKKMFGTSGMAAILPLMKSVKDNTDNATTSWSAFSSQMDKASSSTSTATKFLQDQANEMQKNLGSKIEQVGGNWDDLSNKAMASSAGVTGAFLDMINASLNWSGQSNSSTASVIRQLLGLSPAIGAATVAVGGFLVNIKNIKNGFTDLGVTIKALFTTPLGLALLAVAAFSAAIAGAYKYSKPFRDAIASIANAFNQVFNPAISKSGSTVQKVGSTIGGVIQTISEAVGQKLANAINSINWVKAFTDINKVLKSVLNVANQMIEVFGMLSTKIVNSSAASTAWNLLADSMSVVYDVTKTLFDKFKQLYDILGNVNGQGSNTGRALQSAFALTGVLGSIAVLSRIPRILSLILSPAKLLSSTFGSLLGKIIPFGSGADKAASAASKAAKPFGGFALKALEVGAGIGLAAAGLGALAFGISSLASQGKQGTNTLKAFGIAVGLLAAEFALLGRDLTAGAVGIGVLLGGIAAVALAFTALASTGENGRQTMVTFSVAVGALGVVFALLGPALTAGAVGIGVFGASILAAGVGIGLAASGLASLINALNNVNVSSEQIIKTMGAVGAGFAAMVTGFIASIMQKAPVIVLQFTTMMISIVKIIAIQMPKFIQAGVDLIVNLLNGIITAIPQIAPVIMNLIVTIVSTIVANLPTLVQQGVNLILALINGIVTAVPQIVPALVNMFAVIMDTIDANLPQLITSGVNLIVTLIQGLTQAVPLVVPVIINFIVTIINAIAGKIPDIVAAGVNLLVNLIQGISNTIPSIVGTVFNFIVTFIGAVANNLGRIIDAGFNLLGTFILGIVNAIPKITDIAVQAVMKFVYGVGYALGKVAGSGSQLISTFIRGIVNGYGSANGAGSGAGNSVLNGIMRISLFGAGNAIMNGFLSGLRSAYGAVQSFVGGIASWIKQHKGPISYDRKLLIPAGAAIMGGFNQSLQSSFEDVKDTVNGVAPYIQNALTGSSDYMINTRLADNMQLSDGTLSVDMNKNAKPAQINLNMGGSQWNAYVGDISNTQGNNAQLKKNNSVYL